MRRLGKLSIVSPACNEASNLPELLQQIAQVLEPIGIEWELIVVDDGSTDGTFEVVRELRGQNAHLKGIRLSRNFGHEAATTAGLHRASGDAVVVIDADLQDPPEAIARFVEAWEEGYDIVTGRRLSREGEGALKRLTSYLYSRMIFSMAGWAIPKDTGDFGLYDRKVIEVFRNCPEHNRLVRALFAWSGFRRTEVTFHRKPRLSGETKYSLFRLIALGVNSLLSFSIVPLRAIWVAGLFIMGIAVAGFGAALLSGAMSLSVAILASLWFFGGVQAVLLGLVGEYVGKIYVEVQNKPNYVVQESLGVDA